MNETDLEPLISRYSETLFPLFDCTGDRFDYVLALLRASGLEDAGWDTLEESFRVLSDLQLFAVAELPGLHFENPENTRLRLKLLEYCHLVEMDAPYEILANLCRVRLGLAVSNRPFAREAKEGLAKQIAINNAPARKLHPQQKIDSIKKLTTEAGLPAIGTLFDDFYRAGIRNAISHSDYIIFGDEFRMRGQTIPTGRDNHIRTSVVKLVQLRELIDHARAFYLAFIRVEKAARLSAGNNKGRGFPYDHEYKGILEVLADDGGYLCGAVIHWPNGLESRYLRTTNGSKPINIIPLDCCLEPFVGEKPIPHDSFSPLLAPNKSPRYTPLVSSGQPLEWCETES
jgi:hypothetical protein